MGLGNLLALAGIFSWIIAPIAIGMAFVPDVLGILHRSPSRSIAYAYIWDFYGDSAASPSGSPCVSWDRAWICDRLGLCTAFGTLMPPLFAGEIGTIAHEQSGQVILFGIAVCMPASPSADWLECQRKKS